MVLLKIYHGAKVITKLGNAFSLNAAYLSLISDTPYGLQS